MTLLKNISWDEKYCVLNIYSKLAWVVLSGVLSGLFLAVIFSLCVFPIMGSVAELAHLYWLSVYASLFGLPAFGGACAYIVTMRVRGDWDDYGVYNYKESWSYSIFLVGLLLLGYFVLLNMERLGLTVSQYVWFFPLIVAFVLANFVCHLWRRVQCRFLNIIFPFYYQDFINENRFRSQLKMKISEVRRYGGPLSVFAITLDHKSSLRKKYGSRSVRRFTQEIVQLLHECVRDSDIFGTISDGSMILALARTSRVDSEVVGQRVLRVLKDKHFRARSKQVQLTVSIGVSVYNSETVSVDDLMLGAIALANKATEGGGNTVVTLS